MNIASSFVQFSKFCYIFVINRRAGGHRYFAADGTCICLGGTLEEFAKICYNGLDFNAGGGSSAA